MAFRQPDSRGVIAYSSIAQSGMICLGIFVLNDIGATGATFQMVNHALLSTILFLIAGFVEVRFGTGLFARVGALAHGRPALATIAMATGVAALAVPGSNLFASEFLVLLGAFRRSWLIGTVASLAIVLAAMYMLRWISAVLHDPVGDATLRPAAADARRYPDVRWEAVYLAPLIAAVLVLSAYPYLVTHRVQDDVGKLTAPGGPGGRPMNTPVVQWSAISPELDPPGHGLLPAGHRGVHARARRRGASRPAWRCWRSSAPALASLLLWDHDTWLVMAGQLRLDRFTTIIRLLVAVAGLVTVLSSWGTRRLDDHIGEYYALLLTAAAGMSLLAGVNGFVTLFVALELFSLALYILCALDLTSRGLARGRAEVPGDRLGRLGLPAVRLRRWSTAARSRCASTGSSGDPVGRHAAQELILLGIGMVIAGLAFKASAAPFHMWTPDAYEGAPTAITGFMAAATKTVALAVLLRVLVQAFEPASDVWEDAVAAIAIASMLIGNIAALAQTNAKRMLAYSSIGQAGVPADPGRGPHRARRPGADLLPRRLQRDEPRRVRRDPGARARGAAAGGLDELSGWGYSRPWLGRALALFLFSLASFPPTGGLPGQAVPVLERGRRGQDATWRWPA